MSAVAETSPLKPQILEKVEIATQQDAGHDIDVLIGEIAKTPFEKLSEEYESDKLDKHKITKIKFAFSITSVVLSVVAITAAIASIIFATGAVTPGSEMLAVVTGFVGVSTSFSQLDQAIYRYINFHNEQKKKRMRIDTLAKKINRVKDLLSGRIAALGSLDKSQPKEKRASEILNQIEKVNGFVKKIKEQVPAKITSFGVFNPAPLLDYVGCEG